MRIKTLLLALILAAGTPFASLAEAATPPPAAQNQKIDRALQKKLSEAKKKAQDAEKAEKARETAAAKAKKSKAAKDENDASKATENAQQATREAADAYAEMTRVIVRETDDTKLNVGQLKKMGGTVYRKFLYFPGIAVEIPLESLELLAGKNNVAGISEDSPTSRTAYDDIALVTGATAAAEAYGGSGAGIGVAVIDSGIANVADLQSSLLGRVDFTMFPDRSPFDPFGHGTHVAGIIAGDGVSSGGVYGGIAPDAHLIDLRTLDANGRGYTSDAIAALEWAIQYRDDHNIRVINMSLGHVPYEAAETDPLSMVSRMAVEHGIVVVAAAGNLGQVEGEEVYGGITSPGIEPSVITVGAVTAWGTPSRSDDTVASYSSRGPTRYDEIIKPDITAPGTQIVAPMSPGNNLAMEYPNVVVDDNYMWLSGTSMSAPMVSAAVALILEQNPDLTPSAVKGILMYTAEDTVANPLQEGAGYLNIAGALNLAANIDATVEEDEYWLIDNGTGLTYQNQITDDYTAVWGETIVWGKTIAWGKTIVWGKTIAWDEIEAKTIVWGKTIVWDDIDAKTIVWGKTIAWEDF